MSEPEKNVKPSELQPASQESLPAVTESPAMMMIRAKEAGLDAGQMKEMLEVQKDWESNEALKAFNVAIAEFRSDPITVYKDKTNKQYDSSYVSIGNMVNTVSAELSKYGLSARWTFGSLENNNITCTCILSHKLGHSESATVDGPPDESGKKNALQARKSTRTYLKLESFESVTGMASVEANLDDDGNGADTIERISESQIADLEALIDEVGADGAQFLKVCKVEKWEFLPADKLAGAINMLESKRDQE